MGALALAVAACGPIDEIGTGSTTTSPRHTTTTPGPTAAPSTTTTAPPPTTTTTVVGPHGSPSAYPAAQAKPPSLAGAMPSADRTTDLATVLATLQTYRDWVWSHPDPSEVARYADPSGSLYRADRAEIVQLASLHVRASPTPTTITWVRVTRAPNLVNVRDGKDIYEGGAAVEAIFDLKDVPLLTSSGARARRSYDPPRTGLVAYRITFTQSESGQWVIDQATSMKKVPRT